jgi:hypothetical protein
MDFIEKDNINTPYSKNDVYLTIKYILKTEPERFQRWSIISYLIQYISDEKLLTSTIELFKEIDFLSNKLKTANITLSNNNDYSALEKIKINAITHSLILSTEINLKKFSSLIIVSEVPALQLILNNRRIEHNLTEIGSWIKRNSIKSFIDTTVKLPILRDQENAIKKLIQSMSGLAYLHDTDFFLKEIDYLSVIKKNLFEERLPSGPPFENEQDKMYFKVGLLFAEKKIYSKIVVINNYKTTKYYHEKEVFDNVNQLSIHLNLTRQYINDSFTDANSNHNIFKNFKQLKNIVDYCNNNAITIDIEFLNRYSALIENRQ